MLEFLSRFDWPLFRPAAGLNPEPPNLNFFDYQAGIHPAKGKILDGCDANI